MFYTNDTYSLKTARNICFTDSGTVVAISSFKTFSVELLYIGSLLLTQFKCNAFPVLTFLFAMQVHYSLLK